MDYCCHVVPNGIVSDIAVFVLKRDVILQPTNQPTNPNGILIGLAVFAGLMIMTD